MQQRFPDGAVDRRTSSAYLMSINPGDEIGLEMHPDVDQFLRIEQGHGLVSDGI